MLNKPIRDGLRQATLPDDYSEFNFWKVRRRNECVTRKSNFAAEPIKVVRATSIRGCVMSVHVTGCSTVIGRYRSDQSRCPCVSGPHRMPSITDATTEQIMYACNRRSFGYWKKCLGRPTPLLAALTHKTIDTWNDNRFDIWR